MTLQERKRRITSAIGLEDGFKQGKIGEKWLQKWGLTKIIDRLRESAYNSVILITGDRNVFEEIFSKDLLLEKAAELRKRNFHPGFDNMDAEGARIWIELNYPRFLADLRGGRYAPMPALGFRTAKTSGGYRNLSRLTALDTVLQMSANEVLSPWNESRFSESSFAYRPGRGVGAAIRTYASMAQEYPCVAKIDVVSCYDNIDWSRLEECLASFYDDRPLTQLLMAMAKMPVLSEGDLIKRDRGILQGAPVSALLCNLYYHPLDCLLGEKGIAFIRYADDVVVFSKDVSDAEEVYHWVCDYIEREMCLTRNLRKCRITSSDSIRYLGYKFRRDRHGVIALESNSDTVSAYYRWNESRAQYNHRTADVLSSGILRQKDFSLQFETDETKTLIPPESTEIINLYSNVIFDTGFLKRAFLSGITINVFDRENRFLGSFTPNQSLRSPKTTHSQLLAYYNESERLALAKDILRASTHNSVLNIRYYNKQYPDPFFAEVLEKISGIDKKVKNCSSLESIMLYEAAIREAYYSCYDRFLIAEGFSYHKRTRRPPQNEFNAMLSFGNTVLYNLIATEINKSPLDIRIGFLHATNRRMQSLNLDLAELFKPLVVDRTILSLINRGVIHTDSFCRDESGGVYLNEEGKHVFLRSFYLKLETELTVNGAKMSYYQLFREEVAKLVRYFRSGTPYRAFRQVR